MGYRAGKLLSNGSGRNKSSLYCTCNNRFSKFEIHFFHLKQEGRSITKCYPSDLTMPAVLFAEKFYLITITNLKRHLENKILTVFLSDILIADTNSAYLSIIELIHIIPILHCY